MPPVQYKDAVTRIRELLRTTFGGYFKQYYEGDPLLIPKANLPCVIVEKIATGIETGATGTDEMSSQISLSLVFNKEDDYNSNEDTNSTEKKLRELVEGRDADTGAYSANSVLGALRRNITLGQVILDEDVTVTYLLQPREDDVVTSEASISISCRERVLIPDRN